MAGGGSSGVQLSADARLDNKPWLELVKECTDFLTEIDEMVPRLVPAARPTAEHVRARLMEILERAGVSRIEGDDRFDIARHQPWPPQRVTQGAIIAETTVPGLAIGPRILKRAKVKVADGTRAAGKAR